MAANSAILHDPVTVCGLARLGLMEFNSATLSLLVTGALFAALQLWWIASLLRRNRRHRLAEPLSGREFRRQLERIFKDSP